MRIFGIGAKPQEVKENPAAQSMIVVSSLMAPQLKNLRQYYQEAYQHNAIAFRAIKEVTTAIANLELELHSKGKPVTADQFKALLPAIFNPNPNESWDSFITGCFIDYFCAGEIWISGVTVGKNKLQELWRQSPIYMKVEPGQGGVAKRYIYDAGGVKTYWDVDRLNGQSDMCFYRAVDPLDYWRGQSPLQAAGLSIDTHNSGLVWNWSLLKNGARPSGILKFKGIPGVEAISRIREFFKKAMQGAHNAGEIPSLVDGAEWQEVSQNARDMDYLKTMKEMSKYIAAAIGVPLPLVDNDSTTFNNMEEAKERFYVDTVLPLFNSFLAQFNRYIQKYIGDQYEIKVNLDSIAALEAVRNRKFDRMIAAADKGVLSIDEARIELGYEELGGEFAVPKARQAIAAPTDPNDPNADQKIGDKEKIKLRKAGFSEDEITNMIDLAIQEYRTIQ